MTKYLQHDHDFGPYENAQCACGESAFVYALGATPVGTRWGTFITNSLPYIDPEKRLGTLCPQPDDVVGFVREIYEDGIWLAAPRIRSTSTPFWKKIMVGMERMP